MLKRVVPLHDERQNFWTDNSNKKSL